MFTTDKNINTSHGQWYVHACDTDIDTSLYAINVALKWQVLIYYDIKFYSIFEKIFIDPHAEIFCFIIRAFGKIKEESYDKIFIFHGFQYSAKLALIFT